MFKVHDIARRREGTIQGNDSQMQTVIDTFDYYAFEFLHYRSTILAFIIIIIIILICET